MIEFKEAESAHPTEESIVGGNERYGLDDA